MYPMKRILLSLALLAAFGLRAQFEPFQNESQYQVMLNLTAVENDQLPVEIVPPLIQEDSVEFHMPRIIPGTYDVHNYGRYVNELKALNGDGEELEVKKLDLNRWRIYNAKDLYKISYQAGDTYDDPKSGIFNPAGTSLEDSVFLLNNFGFIGYIDGQQHQPFKLVIEKPAGFYGSTALQGKIGDKQDEFLVDDYFAVHDNPMLYCVPDTATKMVGNAEVLVSLYSPNGTVTARESLAEIAEVLDGAAEYLGGELPVDKYAVLIYCVDMANAGMSYGALEHHTSTVLYMPEFASEQFYGGVRDITSHEFFHIITPLRIHSEMVADFDFIDPEMSEHIWLYEGVTEYNSQLVQARKGIYDLEQFLAAMHEKMESADNYNQNIPLTVASEHTLEFLKDQYLNFYEKGALAGMALDLKLMQLSDGDYRLIDLLEELGATYGQDTFFVDDQLFEIITERSYPEMREFFARHFEGTEPLPYQELLEMVGVVYQEEVQIEMTTLGNVDFEYNFNTGRITVADVSEMDNFGKELGWEKGDELIEFNSVELDVNNMADTFEDFLSNTEVGEKVKVLVARPTGDEGEYDEVKLKARAEKGIGYRYNVLEPVEEPSARQIEMRKKWINQ